MTVPVSVQEEVPIQDLLLMVIPVPSPMLEQALDDTASESSTQHLSSVGIDGNKLQYSRIAASVPVIEFGILQE